MRKIIKLFEDGNVSVCGLRGRGKDMLIANVVVRRKLPYVSNVNYGGQWFPLDFSLLDCGKNTYSDFISGKVKYYVYPYPLGTDVIVSDAGVILPSQFVSELNKLYPYLSTFMALTRQLGECNFHFNAQVLNRVWDKVREQSDTYISCIRCRVFFRKFVFQEVWLYDRYQSAVDSVPPYSPPSLLSGVSAAEISSQRQSYLIQYGNIKRRFLLYVNKSSYDTHFFRTLLANGIKR